jgi:hypothetical protein
MAIAEAEQRARAVESDAEARIRAAEARLRVQERERAADRAEREAGRAEQVAAREAKTEAAAVRRAQWAQYRDTTSSAAPATLSMLVYLAAVASAVFGQVSVATGRYHWALWRALLLAGFIELMALAMATTANRLRLRGENALAPRVLTWVFAGFAAGVNVWGHFSDPLMAIGLGAASLGGITLWEIRSSARHRDALRAAGQLAQPLPSLGLRFWLSQPPVAVAAYRIGIRTRVSPAAEPLVERALAQREARVAARRVHGRGWSRILTAGIVGTTVGAAATTAWSGGRLPVIAGVGAAWWLGGAALVTLVLVGVIVPAVWRAARRAADLRAYPVEADGSTGDLLTGGKMSTSESTEMAAVTSARASEHPPAGVPADDGGTRSGDTPVNGSTSGVPAVLSATGEFRALTAPEHYHRDAMDGRASLGPVLRAARGGTRTAPAPAPAPQRVTPGRVGEQVAAGVTGGRKTAPRRGVIPEDAKLWLAEQVWAGNTPSGPEIGRRFHIDPRTGRRWLKRVRDSLPVAEGTADASTSE